MPTTAPFRLLPAFHERPWGKRSLSPWFDVASGAPLGEAWFTAADCATSLGVRLGDLLWSDPRGLLGGAGFPGDQPLLLKMLFTSDRLSVQVHPDDDYARQHHDSAGKTEAWHVLSAEPAAAVGLGFTRELAADEARDAARSGAIENLLAWHPAHAGDTFLVPAGTVHAIGAGLTIVEVQEPSDITYRLYDYGRPRELHLEHGFAVARLGPYDTRSGTRTLSQARTWLTGCKYFAMERVHLEGRRSFLAGEPFYHLLVVLAGEVVVDGVTASPGDVFFVPAAAREFEVSGACADLLATYSAEHPSRAMMGW